MRRLTFTGAVCAGLLLATALPGAAQEKQWRFTPYAGGTIFAGTVDFDNSFAVGGSAMFRKGRFGVELTGLFTPSSLTSLVAFTRSDLGVPGGDQELLISYAGDQDMFFSAASLVFFSGQSWGADEPPPAREWYGLVGAGLVSFVDAHPARSLEANADDPVQGWDSGTSELMFNVGVGVQFALSSNLSLQLEARDMIFQAQERFASVVNRVRGASDDDAIEKSLHNNIVLRQGVTFVIF